MISCDVALYGMIPVSVKTTLLLLEPWPWNAASKTRDAFAEHLQHMRSNAQAHCARRFLAAIVISHASTMTYHTVRLVVPLMKLH